jgi:hypothetical protein
MVRGGLKGCFDLLLPHSFPFPLEGALRKTPGFMPFTMGSGGWGRGRCEVFVSSAVCSLASQAVTIEDVCLASFFMFKLLTTLNIPCLPARAAQPLFCLLLYLFLLSFLHSLSSAFQSLFTFVAAARQPLFPELSSRVLLDSTPVQNKYEVNKIGAIDGAHASSRCAEGPHV